jgi:K+-transporting ATPase ATPase C chain
MKTAFHYFRVALFLFILLTVLTGVIYPALITGIAQWVFTDKANGSFIAQGSTLIQQPFDQPKYFWGRPSATTPFPSNAASSGASNLGPTNPALIAAVKTRIALLKKVDPTNTTLIPVDLVTTSGSGLDPEISPDAAYYQAPRIARLRHLPLWQVTDLISANIQPRQFDLLGEPRVNVLQLNIALDGISKKA